MQEDTYKHKGMRKKLIVQLKKMGIKEKRVLDAIDEIPRHFFLDLVFEKQAYSNQPFQIGAGQTISQPYTVAFQTELLKIKKGDKVLEIGTGSGFQTCILCALGAKVFSIERQRELFLKAKKIIEHFRFNPRLSYGDGYKGMPAFAPFDKIIITCGAPFVPDALVEQLAVGGVMVIPVGDGKQQVMQKIVKQEDGSISTEELGAFSFVPMLEDKEKGDG